MTERTGPREAGLRVLVCGGRNYRDMDCVRTVLCEIHWRTPINVIIHGAASGADRLADKWADERSVEVEAYPADWGTLGRAAGPIRNATMLRAGKPDLVVAFPGGAGTSNMVRQAIAASVRVQFVRPGVSA